MLSGRPGIGIVPTMVPFSHSATAPPGASRTSRAAPCRTKRVASVTTISGTRVTTIRMPLTAPSTSPMASTNGTTKSAYSSLAPFIIEAAVTLVSAIMAATERSMPPAMTTIVWAATAKA